MYLCIYCLLCYEDTLLVNKRLIRGTYKVSLRPFEFIMPGTCYRGSPTLNYPLIKRSQYYNVTFIVHTVALYYIIISVLEVDK